MKRRDLEITLQNIRQFENPDVSLEQYPTPAYIATDILFTAYSEGFVANKRVGDFGCGTGIFAIGASLLGASSVIAYDVSSSALSIAIENSNALKCNIEFVECDVSNINNKFDTVFMNPPFGSQRKHADLPFLDKAIECSNRIYSIHMETTLPYLSEYVKKKGREVSGHITYKYEIPHTFAFHKKTKQTVDIAAIEIK